MLHPSEKLTRRQRAAQKSGIDGAPRNVPALVAIYFAQPAEDACSLPEKRFRTDNIDIDRSIIGGCDSRGARYLEIFTDLKGPDFAFGENLYRHVNGGFVKIGDSEILQL
jgi:hypothetical protein